MDNILNLAERFEQIAAEARMYSDDVALARARAFEQAAKELRQTLLDDVKFGTPD